MKPLFIKKNGTVSKVSGIIMNLIPSYTMAEYNALTHKPLLWVRTDEDYAQIPSEDVSYGNVSVEDALDDTVSKANGGRFGNDITIDHANGTASAEGYTSLYLGNSTPIGQAGNSIGQVVFNRGQNFVAVLSGALTANRWAFLPDKTGTIALTSDITDVTSYAFTPSANSQIVESSINKVGRIVDCHLVLKILSSTAGSSVQLGTIPVGARPLANQSQVFLIGEGILTTITVATNGAVYYYSNTSALNWILRIQFTYISAT